MPGLIAVKKIASMSVGRKSAMHQRTGPAGCSHFSTTLGPRPYMSQTKASLVRRQSQGPASITNLTFTAPEQDSVPCIVSWSSSSSDTAAKEGSGAAASSGLDSQWLDGYCHEDTPWEIMQFRPHVACEYEVASSWDDREEDAWSCSVHTAPVAADDESGQPWDVNYVHSDTAWEFLQFGTKNFMDDRPISDNPNAVWDAPMDDPIEDDVALQCKLDHEDHDHDDESCACGLDECGLDEVEFQKFRDFAKYGFGYGRVTDSSERVCIACGGRPCECDDAELEQTRSDIANEENVYSNGNIDSQKTQSSRYLDKRAAALIAEIDKLVDDVDYLKRQKLRFARDAARYLNVGQRFRSQFEKSNVELRNCRFRLMKSQGISSRFRQAFLQLGFMLQKYHQLGITEVENDVLGQVRFILGPLADLARE